METDSHTPPSARRKPFWSNIVWLAFIVTLTIMAFLLAHSMVHHRFHRGGWVNHHGVLKP
jgi:uncharacterized membrane protein YhaH (DUF805 family)